MNKNTGNGEKRSLLVSHATEIDPMSGFPLYAYIRASLRVGHGILNSEKPIVGLQIRSKYSLGESKIVRVEYCAYST